MISLIIGFFSGLLVFAGLNQNPQDAPALFSFAIIFIVIIAFYLLYRVYLEWNKNKLNRLDVKIKKEQLKKELKNNSEIQKTNSDEKSKNGGENIKKDGK